MGVSRLVGRDAEVEDLGAELARDAVIVCLDPLLARRPASS